MLVTFAAGTCRHALPKQLKDPAKCPSTLIRFNCRSPCRPQFLKSRNSALNANFRAPQSPNLGVQGGGGGGGGREVEVNALTTLLPNADFLLGAGTEGLGPN